jgi:hypothetical protein
VRTACRILTVSQLFQSAIHHPLTFAFFISFRYGDDAQKILLEPPPPAVVIDAEQKSEIGSSSSEEIMTRLK